MESSHVLNAHSLAGKVACVDLPRGDSVGVLADGVVVVAWRVNALNGVLGVGVNAAALEGRVVATLLLGDNILGSLQGLQVSVEEASLLADWLVAADHFEVWLEHFRLTLVVRGGPQRNSTVLFARYLKTD